MEKIVYAFFTGNDDISFSLTEIKTVSKRSVIGNVNKPVWCQKDAQIMAMKEKIKSILL